MSKSVYTKYPIELFHEKQALSPAKVHQILTDVRANILSTQAICDKYHITPYMIQKMLTTEHFCQQYQTISHQPR